MMAAEKKPTTVQPRPENDPAPAAKDFGKVLNSIQGLQQRLDDFSFDEADRADQEARKLIQRLKDIQWQLALIGELRTVAAKTDRILQENPQANFDTIPPDSLDNYPQLRTIIQAGKLVRIFRIWETARTNAQAVSLGLTGSAELAGQGDSTEVFIAEPGVIAKTGPEAPAAQFSIQNTEQPPKVMIAPDLTVKTVAPSAPLTGARESQAVKPTPTSKSPSPRIEPIRQRQQHKISNLRESTPPEAVGLAKKENTASNKGHFDERLLHDVIDTYGEFVASANTLTPSEPAKVARPSAEQAASNPHLPVVSGAALVPGNAEPEDPLALPPPQEKTARRAAVETFVPSIRDRSEIDRQLKSIIKDYGEYDLYSRSKPSTFNKSAVIAAFILLGLVLGGFYFFKSPPLRAPATVESAEPGQVTHDGRLRPSSE